MGGEDRGPGRPGSAETNTNTGAGAPRAGREAGGQGGRADRLKTALKANLQRRKAARRAASEGTGTADGQGRSPEEGQDG